MIVGNNAELKNKYRLLEGQLRQSDAQTKESPSGNGSDLKGKFRRLEEQINADMHKLDAMIGQDVQADTARGIAPGGRSEVKNELHVKVLQIQMGGYEDAKEGERNILGIDNKANEIHDKRNTITDLIVQQANEITNLFAQLPGRLFSHGPDEQHPCRPTMSAQGGHGCPGIGGFLTK